MTSKPSQLRKHRAKFYDNYFVPRGYAIVLVDVGGTNRSRGCFDDVASGLGVIDWLNGRAAGYSAVEGGSRVRADWANGSVAAIGKSQDGAAAIGMASTGIDGLKTIVPIAGVSSYYLVGNQDGAYLGWPDGDPPGLLNPRAQELCKPYEAEQDRLAGTDGSYNPYWLANDYVAAAGKVRASVFAIQGMHDPAVRPLQFGPWWEALNRLDVPRRAWLHQAAHVDPFDLQRAEFVTTLHRWMDRWLLGVRNGIDREPRIHLEHRTDQWVDEAQWPPAGGRPRTWWPQAQGGLAGSRGSGEKTIVDDPALTEDDWAANPGPSPSRVLFTSDRFAADTRLSGSGTVTVRVRPSATSATVSAVLVDYGKATARVGSGIKNLATRSCWGASTPADSACYLDTAADTGPVDYQLLTNGSADIGHHRSLWRAEQLTPGRWYSMTFRLNTLDHVIPAGHQLGLILAGTDGSLFDPALPHRPSEPAFDLAGTSVTIPGVLT
ncbi:CocE/NonD family hydrolase C-terminal non-catalytic domain-containing protein [Amycolatopsis sp. cg5]|uniref:CocE/NonD family hydrolase C-terminal non-catalytic domain-containing protein n=1 Tax=Amycolatopsis sp. cg5 TaxID=3238802 RepID=UPI003524A9C0